MLHGFVTAQIGLDRSMIEFTESTKRKYQVDAEDVTGVVEFSGSFVEIIQDLFEVLSGEDRAMKIQPREIYFQHVFRHLAILGQQHIDGWRTRYRPIK